MDREKHVDESWKDSVAKQKDEPLIFEKEGQDIPEVNFITYLTSLAFQTMIFLGDLENPVTQKVEQNLPQAKFLIDTLLMLREKTKGNLNKDEDDLLNGALYELQIKYVERFDKIKS